MGYVCYELLLPFLLGIETIEIKRNGISKLPSMLPVKIWAPKIGR